MITIFTPTYNRAYILPKLFESLCLQHKKEFIWLIVDDGSTDDTKNLVENFVQRANFPIHYIFQENQGKHVAYNTALDNISTKYFVTVDSDDILVKEALGILRTKLHLIENNMSIAGVTSPIKKMNKEELLISKSYDRDIFSFPLEFKEKYNIIGEFTLILKTNEVRKYKYPVFEGEKFMKESVVQNRIGSDYKFLYIKESIVEAEYREDGLSAKFSSLLKNSPKGAALSFQELMNNPFLRIETRIFNVLLFWDYESIYNRSIYDRLIKIESNKLKLFFLIEKLKKNFKKN